MSQMMNLSHNHPDWGLTPAQHTAKKKERQEIFSLILYHINLLAREQNRPITVNFIVDSFNNNEVLSEHKKDLGNFVNWCEAKKYV